MERLAKRFLATQGDLKEVAKTLVTAPEAWEAPRAKLKRPGEWIVGALRAVGVTPPDIGPMMQAHNLLGEPLWRPSAPKGFADESAPWLDGLAQRLDIANQLARRVGGAGRSERGVRGSAGADRLDRDAPGHHARREPPAGARALVHGARIPTPMTRRDAMRHANRDHSTEVSR